MDNIYRQPVTLRLATREDLESRGYEQDEIDKILENQSAKYDAEPGEVLAVVDQPVYGKVKWADFSIQG